MSAKRLKVVAAAEKVNMATGEPYVAEPVRDGKTAMRACLHMVLKHTADMFISIVDIVAEKYEIDKDEIVEVIRQHPRFKEMDVDPVMLDLGYILDPAASSGAAAVPSGAAAPEAAATASELEPKKEAKPARIFKIKPKKVATAAAATEEPPAPAE
jgi:hypothetical protein